MVDLKNTDAKTITVELIVAALGLYLALAFNDAIKKSIDRILPNDDDELKNAWISAGVSLAIVLIIIFLIVNYVMKNNSK
tara:strand:- start:1113 stop:1352 length:240 start_codon:yes stop_codon:yes gene_type:complete